MLCDQESKQTVKKEIDCDDVKAEDTYTLGNENYSNISNTQPKSEVEEHEPQMASQTKPAALVQTVQIPFAATADDTKNGLSGLQEVYQPTANGAIGTLGILPQAIPPLLPTPIFPYDNGCFLPQTVPQMVSNQPLFSGDRPTFTGSTFTAANILNSASNQLFLKQFHSNTLQSRRRLQAVNCHENSQCVNCRTTNTSLWRRNEHGEVECNACNLYFRKNKRPRPLSLCKDTIMKRNRKPVVDRQTSS